MTYSEKLREIHQAIADIRPPDDREISHLEHRQKQYRKWQLVHAYVSVRPFRDKPRYKRSRQWQEAMNQVRELRDQEVIDWLWIQSDVARNFENGIQDMRPRPKGTCHQALVAYLRQREHKALVVLQWEEEAQEHGCFRVNSSFHARTREILDKYYEKQKEEESSPMDPNDPWLRS